MVTERPERESLEVPPRRPTALPLTESNAALRELVQRIVHSATFGRSERLGTLLTYVCDLSLKGRGAEINEQKIGHAVFGRSPDYDSAVDGIVRSQASRLRQRLELYYQHEGAKESIRLSIPRGGYVPIFEPQRMPSLPVTMEVREPGTSPFSDVAAQSIESRDVLSSFRRWLPWGICVVLAMTLAALWSYDRRLSGREKAEPYKAHPLWSHLFTRNQPTLIVAPDSGLVLFHGMSGQDLDLKAYLDAGYRSEQNGLAQIGPAASKKESLVDLANRRYTSIVDLKTILGLKDRARSQDSEVSVKYARDLRPNDFKTGNVILLGASEADPWIELYEQNMNFVLRDDYKDTFSIINRNPQNGEPERWESKRNDSERRVFGVVAYLPSLSGDGDALLLEGTGMSGAEAGMDFILDDTQLLPFLKQIRRHDGTLPHFEVLLETHNIGASSVRSQIISWRAR